MRKIIVFLLLISHNLFALGIESIFVSDALFFKRLAAGIAAESKKKEFRTIRDSDFRKDDSIDLSVFAPKFDFQEEILQDSEEIFDASQILENLDGKDERGIEDESAAIPEFSYFDKTGQIRRFSFDGEQMTARQTKDGAEICSVFQKKIKRRRFDSRFRLVSVEIFELPSKARSLKRISRKVYFYRDRKDFFPSIPSRSEEETKNLFIETIFTSSGLAQNISQYSVDEKGKRVPQKKRNRKYDSEDRVIFDENIFWSDGEEFSARYEYAYTGVAEEADFDFYEDGILRLSRVHTTAKNWIERTVFDDSFVVITEFENGAKVSESVMFGGKEVRRRIFGGEKVEEFNEKKKNAPFLNGGGDL